MSQWTKLANWRTGELANLAAAFLWPASFMLDRLPWATRRALLAVAGVALIMLARRR